MLRRLKPGRLLLVIGIAIILGVGLYLFWQLRLRQSGAAATDVAVQETTAQLNPGQTQISVNDIPVVISTGDGTRKILSSEVAPTPAPTPIPSPTPEPAEESVAPEAVAPTAEPPTPNPTAVPPVVDNSNCGTGRSHTVQQGENVFRIARAFGVNQDDIRNINGLDIYYTIYPGDVLCLPGSASGAPSESTQGQPGATIYNNGICGDGLHEHTVFNGTTLFGLALEHNTTVDNLRAINGLGNDTIYPGQILCMPN